METKQRKKSDMRIAGNGEMRGKVRKQCELSLRSQLFFLEQEGPAVDHILRKLIST